MPAAEVETARGPRVSRGLSRLLAECAEHDSASGGECRVYGCSYFGWMNRVRDTDDGEESANP